MIFKQEKLGILFSLYLLIALLKTSLQASITLSHVGGAEEFIASSDLNYSDLQRAIKRLNPGLYEKLQLTQAAQGTSLKKGLDGSGLQIITQGDYVFISLDSQTIDQMLSKTPAVQDNLKSIINKQWDAYRETNLSKNRVKILEIIKNLAPELHAKIVQFDTDGSQHLVIGDGLAVRCFNDDGLPIIMIDDNFLHESAGSQKAGIAHELGHYALEHGVIRNTTYNEKSGEFFNQIALNTTKNTNSVKASRATLEPNKAMIDAYVRTYEYEADRFAMISMGVDYEDVEAMVASWNDSTNGCTTFGIDHPLDQNRLKQFQDLKSEVALQKQSPSLKTAVNWDNVQYDTLKNRLYTFKEAQFADYKQFDFYEPTMSQCRDEFEAAIQKYLPQMASKAQAEMNEKFKVIDSVQINVDEKSLSTQDWVSVHRVLLKIDNKAIQELQSCEATHGSCIVKGEDGTGIRIIPENAETGTRFSISFDEDSLNKINSKDPKVVTKIITTITNTCNQYAPQPTNKIAFKRSVAKESSPKIVESPKAQDISFGLPPKSVTVDGAKSSKSEMSLRIVDASQAPVSQGEAVAYLAQKATAEHALQARQVGVENFAHK